MLANNYCTDTVVSNKRGFCPWPAASVPSITRASFLPFRPRSPTLDPAGLARLWTAPTSRGISPNGCNEYNGAAAAPLGPVVTAYRQSLAACNARPSPRSSLREAMFGFLEGTRRPLSGGRPRDHGVCCPTNAPNLGHHWHRLLLPNRQHPQKGQTRQFNILRVSAKRPDRSLVVANSD